MSASIRFSAASPDFDALLTAAHAVGLKVILDLVPNQHLRPAPLVHRKPLFARQSKRDWYLWREPRVDGTEPNNWMSEFGGSAWAYDAVTRQYYYQRSWPSSPTSTGATRRSAARIYDAMRFWLAKGVDGFRVDVIWHLIKDDQFRDNPPNQHFRAGRPPHEALVNLYSADQPKFRTWSRKCEA